MHIHIRQSKFLPFAGIVLLVLIAALPVLAYPMGRDQGMYANIGRTILRGGTPFIDMWDIKPPPIYYIYAAGIGIFGTTTASIRALDFILIPFGMLGLFLFGDKLKNQRLGLLTAFVYGVFYFNEDFQNLTQSDSLVTVPMIWAAYTAYRSMLSHDVRFSWRWALVSGALCGLILWFKYYYIFFVLALVVNRVLAHFKSGEKGLLWRDALAFAGGGLLTGGALLLYFWSKGIIGEMEIVAQGTAAYNAQGYDFAAFIANMRNYWYFRWLTWNALLVLAGLWPVLRIIGFIMWRKGMALNAPINPATCVYGRDASRPYEPSPLKPNLVFDLHHSAPTEGTYGEEENSENFANKLGWWLVWSWLVAALAFALIQAKGFDTHWIPMLPALALLAGDVIDRIVQFLVQVWRALPLPDFSPDSVAIVWYSLAMIGLLAIMVQTTWGRSWRYLTGQETRVAYFDRFQANDLKPEESLLMAQYLRERVLPGDSLFIWGFRPEVYYMAQLHPATRYQAQFPLVAPWYPAVWREDNVAILRAALPPYALILQDDFMPWVTNIDADSHTILQDSAHDELRFWFQANYEPVDEIGDFIIWKRKS